MRMIFFALWVLSLLLMLAAAAQLWRAFVRKKEEVTRTLAKSLGLLFVSIFCVRLAVGLYLADGALVEEPNGLNLFETALDSAVHSLQTFSMDEGYTDYLFAGRDLWQWMSGSAAAVTLAGMYISLQNLLAPIAGGAILLDLLSNLFPWIRYYLQGGRRKYVFSELNEQAVLLAEDLARAEQGVGLVGEAAQHCYGVAGMASSSASDSIKSLILGKNRADKGVRVSQVDGKLAIELHIMVGYGLNISSIVQSISHRVRNEVETATGLKVARVDVCVDDVIDA